MKSSSSSLETGVDRDQEHEPLSSPQHRHRHPQYYSHKNKLVAEASKIVYKRPRTSLAVLLIFTFLLGYICNSLPLLSQSAAELGYHRTFPPESCTSPPVASSQVRDTIFQRVYNGRSPWDGFPPEHLKSSGLIQEEWTKGWGSNAPVFEHLIRQVRPKTIIEIGTFLGASATHMVGLTKKMGLNDTQIICIDDFRGWPGYYDQDQKSSIKLVNGDSMLLYQFMQNVVRAKATDSVVFLPFSAGTALGGLCDWGVYGDLIEVDAAHDFHSAWVDINNAYKLLKPGGVLFGHDIVWEGVRNAVHAFARIHGFRVKVDGEHWILY